jgi:LPXTG-site transpeptidase (sortase) family protein
MHENVGRIYLTLGYLCILAGAAILIIAGYSLVTEDDGSQPSVYVRPAWPSVTPTAADAQQDPAPFAGKEYRLVIDKIGVDAPVAPYGLDENSIPQVPFEAQVVAWYNFSAQPGAGDNAVFAGHKTWGGEAVFFDLEGLVGGDRIVLRAESGEQLVYEVTEKQFVEPNDPSALDWMRQTGTDSITLITCAGERFLTETPAGADYTLRVVLRADRLPNESASSQSGG